jgi:hypothetical protein
MTRYLTADDMQMLNARFVGPDKLRDYGLLESAVLRPQARGHVASAEFLENSGAFGLRQQPGHWGYFPHLDVLAVESGEGAVQASDVTAGYQCFPSVEVADVWLAPNAAA